ncbi:MAG: Ku protein, partial [Thiohalocapsa sp.]
TLDLTIFVPRAEIDPIYFDQPYYLYPDGAVAAEAFEVIAAAMTHAGMAGLGRIAMSRRERMVMVEPRGAGLVTITLRAAAEIRAAEFPPLPAELDPDMVATAEAIIARRTGHFDPSTFRDRYQEALRELIEAKLKGRRIVVKPPPPAPPVVDLMAALKRSLAQETAAAPARRRRHASGASGDRRQANMLLPIDGQHSETADATADPAPRRRRRG